MQITQIRKTLQRTIMGHIDDDLHSVLQQVFGRPRPHLHPHQRGQTGRQDLSYPDGVFGSGITGLVNVPLSP